MEVKVLDTKDGARRLEVLSDWNPQMQIKRVKKKNEEGEEDEDDEEGKEDEEED